MIRIRKHQSEFWLPAPIEKVFPFFANANNLDLITPGWLRFRVLTPPAVEITEGTLLNYRLWLRGIPISWQSLITLWEPPHGFVDQQQKGPYRMWIHEHRFAEQEGGTLIRDLVHYATPGGALLEPFLHHLLVYPDVERIFEYRRAKLLHLCKEGKL